MLDIKGRALMSTIQWLSGVETNGTLNGNKARVISARGFRGRSRGGSSVIPASMASHFLVANRMVVPVVGTWAVTS